MRFEETIPNINFNFNQLLIIIYIYIIEFFVYKRVNSLHCIIIIVVDCRVTDNTVEISVSIL